MDRDENLESYDSKLLSFLIQLKAKKEEVHNQILREEEDRNKVQREIKILQDRFIRLNESLAIKTQARTEYDKTIAETEAAYSKILESAHTLCSVLQRETSLLDRKVTNVEKGFYTEMEGPSVRSPSIRPKAGYL